MVGNCSFFCNDCN